MTIGVWCHSNPISFQAPNTPKTRFDTQSSSIGSDLGMILFTQGRWLVVAFPWHKDMPHASISFHQPIQFTCFWTKVLAGNMIVAWKGWEIVLNETDKCYCFLSTKPPQDIPQQAVLRCLCRENVPWIHWITLTKQITVPLYLPLPYSPKHSGFFGTCTGPACNCSWLTGRFTCRRSSKRLE